MADASTIDAVIAAATDGFTQVYQTINPPPLQVTPVVYTSASPAGGTAIGVDLSSLLLIVALGVGVWWLLRR